jgi:hypothetical protein
VAPAERLTDAPPFAHTPPFAHAEPLADVELAVDPVETPDAPAERTAAATAPIATPPRAPTPDPKAAARATVPTPPGPRPAPVGRGPHAPAAYQGALARPGPNGERPIQNGDATHATEGDDGSAERGATAPQLRRFIKSRAYVPMHELRRRFAINGADDEVTPVDLERRRIFVGLPEREGRLLGELLRGGDIGFELSMDPISPIVVGVYPMRPVTRS